MLDRARALGNIRSVFVIHTRHGQPCTAGGIGSLFKRARRRAGVEGVSLQDIRATAATGATDSIGRGDRI